MQTDSPQSDAPIDGERAEGLDGLRALAAVAVVLFHLWVYSAPLAPGAALATPGQYVWESARDGLLLFFVLSGFLLYRPWVLAALGRRRPPRLARYLRLRAARIAPGYYLALAGALAIAVLGSAPPMRLPTHGTLPLFLVFGQNFSDHSLNTLDTPMWTLPIEVCFYLSLPLLGLVTLQLGHGRARQALVPVCLIALGVAWTQLATGLWFSGVVLPRMLPFFGLGMLVAVLVAGTVVPSRACRWLVIAFPIVYLVSLAIRATAPEGVWLVGDIAVAAGFAGLVAVAAAGNWMPSPLRARPVVWLGTISYGIYLWHLPVMCLLGGHGLLPRAAWLELPLVAPPTLLLAWASWRFVEAPVLRRAHRRAEPIAPAGTQLRDLGSRNPVLLPRHA
ncbi:MAG: acyltransferase family protein [Solirubrobacterales bacterium]